MTDDSTQKTLSDNERKKRLKKARAALKKKIKTVDQEIRSDLAKTRYVRIKKIKQKAMRKNAMIAAGLLAFVLLVVWIFLPRKGGPAFGLCKTFIELRVEYPKELKYTYAQSYPDKMRVWYVIHDSFGQKQIEKMDCFFRRNQYGGLYLAKAEINRGEVNAKDIKSFNASIPVLMENLPDLTLPRGLPSDVKSFRRN